MSEYDDVLAEVYGTADDAMRARYGPLPKPRARRPPPARVAPLKSANRAGYHVTADARVRCACGVWVYTERRGSGPAALPRVCWRCLKPLDPRGEDALESPVLSAKRETVS